MRPPAIVLAAVLGFVVCNTRAVTRYVDLDSSNPTAPFTNWTTAARNIQDAIDVCADEDVVWVTNGTYRASGKAMLGDLTNRVALDKAITVQSVNGPFATVIQGVGATNGTQAVRCAWLTNGAVLRGFTLQLGATRATGGDLGLGGGAWCASSDAALQNCIVQSNTANVSAAAVYRGQLINCAVLAHRSSAILCYNSILENCTVIGNSTAIQGGALTNCIVYYNTNNYALATLAHCCTTPLPTGPGNISADPKLFENGLHLSNVSPCRGSGLDIATGTDLFDHPWANPPSMGCAEWQAFPSAGRAVLRLNGDPSAVVLSAAVSGQDPLTCFWLKDGAYLPGSSSQLLPATDSASITLNSFDPGAYQLVLSNAVGVVTGAPAALVVHYVNGASTNATAPYLSWTNAAGSIQDAIDAALPGEVVLVTNGIYASGGKSMDGVLTNRVTVDKAILIQSVNGPETTVIQGAWHPVSTNGPGAVRCVWLTNRAAISGFTLRKGATRNGTTPTSALIGGGVFCSSNSAGLYNCVLKENCAASDGGGAYRGTLSHCTIQNNRCFNPGYGTSTRGGGVAYGNLKNSLISSNYAYTYGGGAFSCNATNCAFTQNRAIMYGSAFYGGVLLNSTVTGNTSGGSGAYGGAVASAGVSNCIVWANYNIGSGSTNYLNCTFSYSDTDPLPTGVGNTNVDPQFLPNSFHLSTSSPCVAAGKSGSAAGLDIDDQPWNDPPSMGCDEWQPQPVIVLQPTLTVRPPCRLQLDVFAAGQPEFGFAWTRDGVPIEDATHYGGFGTARLIVNDFGADDAGVYSVVVTNSAGVVTSKCAQVAIHLVDAASVTPLAPYTNWTTAAANIQDAIDAASGGEIVLVTNGVYAAGGKVISDNFTNRVAIDKPLTVISAKGFAGSIIEGQRDPASGNGPGAMRCVFICDGALLSGFTLRNGATRTSGYASSLEGGGVWAASTNGLVSNCVISNNTAMQGGGVSYATVNNSLLTGNFAQSYGGGAYYATLNNCTLIDNRTTARYRGAGTYAGSTRNSIVVANYVGSPVPMYEDNYSTPSLPSSADYSYSCTSPAKSGVGNINASAQFLDWFHIASTSPCFGAGSAIYAADCDLDGEPWADSPSMGCDEVILANQTGPLSVGILAGWTNLVVNQRVPFSGSITGRASWAMWSSGDGTVVTNGWGGLFHAWSAAGDYPLTFTVFNLDNPGGVSASINIHVDPVLPPQLRSATLLTNGFQFEFSAQTDITYTIQYTTDLTPPVTWLPLQTIYRNQYPTQRITDLTATNAARFYRVLAN